MNMRYEILSISQDVFRNSRNSTQAMLEFLQSIKTALNSDEYAIGVFCHLSKAFDTLDHKILLAKLDHYIA